MNVGELIGAGRTSRVYRYGADSVVKVPNPEIPDEWVLTEAHLTSAVHASDVPAPEMREVVQVDGRPAIVLEHIDGESMWQHMQSDPTQVTSLAGDLGEIQRHLSSIGLPEGIPDLVDRVERKLRRVDSLNEVERAEACALLRQLPRGGALLHGDLHPGNVLMAARGPVVIDWFDATVGHPIADVVRTSILLRPAASEPHHEHLPGATIETLVAAHAGFLQGRRHALTAAGDDLSDWQAVLAASRLAEGDHVDRTSLLALWNSRSERALATSTFAVSSPTQTSEAD